MHDATHQRQDNIAEEARRNGGIEAIRMIAETEGWEQSAEYYLEKWAKRF